MVNKLILVAFVFLLELVLVSSLGVNIPIPVSINSTLFNVNNSLYWQGHTGTDGSWLTGITGGGGNSSWNQTWTDKIYIPYFGATKSIFLNNQTLKIQNTKGANVTLNSFVEHTQEMMTNTLLDKSRSLLSVSDGKLNFTLFAFYGCGQFNFNGTLYPISGDPCVPNATITLLNGSDINPKTNYIYWELVGDVPTMKTSETYPATGHIDVGTFVVGNVRTTPNIYSYSRNRYEVDSFVNRILHRFENAGTLYESGFTPSANTTQINVTSGGKFFNGIFEMTSTNNVMSSRDGFYYINGTGQFKNSTDLSVFMAYANGVPFSGGVNERINIIWGLVPINTTAGVGPTQMRLVAVLPNEPTVKYNTIAEAIADIYETANYYPPNNEIKKVFVPIARTIMKPDTDTFELFPSNGYFQDIRGKVTSGGSVSSPVDTSVFLLKDGTTALTGNWNYGGFNLNGTGNFTTTGTGTSGYQVINQIADSQGIQINGYDDKSANWIKLYVQADGEMSIDSSHTLYFKRNGAGVFYTTSTGIGFEDNKNMKYGSSGSNYGDIRKASATDTLNIASVGTTGIKIDSATNLLNLTNDNVITTGNSTSSYGFFTWIGSLAQRITKGWFVDIDASGNVNVTGNVTAGDIIGNNIKANKEINATGKIYTNDSVTIKYDNGKVLFTATDGSALSSIGYAGSGGSLYYTSFTGVHDFQYGSLTSINSVSASSYSAGTYNGIGDTYDDGSDTQITFTGGIATAISTAYDERLMKDIVYTSGDGKKTLTPITFKWNNDGLKQFQNSSSKTGSYTGYIAQDVQSFYPSCIVIKSMNLTGNKIDYMQYDRNCIDIMAFKELNFMKDEMCSVDLNKWSWCK